MILSKSFQWRRENMHKQLPLWPEAEQRNIWEGLDPETQRMVVAIVSSGCSAPQNRQVDGIT